MLCVHILDAVQEQFCMFWLGVGTVLGNMGKTGPCSQTAIFCGQGLKAIQYTLPDLRNSRLHFIFTV